MIGYKQVATINNALKTLPVNCFYSIEHEPIKGGRYQVYIAHYHRDDGEHIVQSWTLSTCKNEYTANRKRDEFENFMDRRWEEFCEGWGAS